jgi:DNA-binding transcriptional regulator YiaG
MTPAEFKQARKALSLSQSEMAIALGLKTARAIRHYESGDRVISGPIEKLVNVLINDR